MLLIGSKAQLQTMLMCVRSCLQLLALALLALYTDRNAKCHFHVICMGASANGSSHAAD